MEDSLKNYNDCLYYIVFNFNVPCRTSPMYVVPEVLLEVGSECLFKNLYIITKGKFTEKVRMIDLVMHNGGDIKLFYHWTKNELYVEVWATKKFIKDKKGSIYSGAFLRQSQKS